MEYAEGKVGDVEGPQAGKRRQVGHRDVTELGDDVVSGVEVFGSCIGTALSKESRWSIGFAGIALHLES